MLFLFPHSQMYLIINAVEGTMHSKGNKDRFCCKRKNMLASNMSVNRVLSFTWNVWYYLGLCLLNVNIRIPLCWQEELGLYQRTSWISVHEIHNYDSQMAPRTVLLVTFCSYLCDINVFIFNL